MTRAYRDFLADMVAHARDAVACVEGLDLAEVKADRLRCPALERCFEIIGEAAGKVEPRIRDRHPEIPWAEMVAVRNRLAHAYFAVDLSILHRTARDRLPALLPLLEQALRDVTSDETGTENQPRAGVTRAANCTFGS